MHAGLRGIKLRLGQRRDHAFRPLLFTLRQSAPGPYPPAAAAAGAACDAGRGSGRLQSLARSDPGEQALLAALQASRGIGGGGGRGFIMGRPIAGEKMSGG